MWFTHPCVDYGLQYMIVQFEHSGCFLKLRAACLLAIYSLIFPDYTPKRIHCMSLFAKNH